MADSIAARYYTRLKNQSGIDVAIFTDWLGLEFGEALNDVGDYTLTFRDNGDERFDLFELDSQIEIYRSVPGVGLDWYLEFEGLHRKPVRDTISSGEKVFMSQGVGYNDLLARTRIAYKAGTIRADKSAPAETAMKEYVDENCTSTGDTTAVGRLNYDQDAEEFLYESALPGFSVESDGGNGEIWSGTRAYESLLDVLQNIANYSGIDFSVIGTGPATFLFKTFVGQLGKDRTVTGLDGTTGNNASGNQPVIFSVPMGVVQDIRYELDRLAEANAVIVLGKGEGSTRKTLTRVRTSAIADSPWNRCEISRPVTNYNEDYETFSLITSGEEYLEQMKAKEIFEFVPLQQASQLYGLHYFLGDRVTAKYGSIERNKRIVERRIAVGEQQRQEQITISFADIPNTP